MTCEVAPHHFALTDDAVKDYDPNAKMSPPLRLKSDIEAIKEGLKDDTIDIIATDHAPHDLVDKQVEFNRACFGIVGLETALPLTLRLVDENVFSMAKMIEKLTSRPAEIFNLDRGRLSVGDIADLVIFDPEAEYVIDVQKFKSRSKNSPFDGWQVKGKIIRTIVAGKTVFSASSN